MIVLGVRFLNDRALDSRLFFFNIYSMPKLREVAHNKSKTSFRIASYL